MGGSAHNGSLVWPALVRHRGVLVALFSSLGEATLFRATSSDDGAHWTQPVRLAVPSNQTPFALLSLRSGRMAMVFNNVADPAVTHLSLSLADTLPALFCPPCSRIPCSQALSRLPLPVPPSTPLTSLATLSRTLPLFHRSHSPCPSISLSLSLLSLCPGALAAVRGSLCGRRHHMAVGEGPRASGCSHHGGGGGTGGGSGAT
jgi:hypothetical protein